MSKDLKKLQEIFTQDVKTQEDYFRAGAIKGVENLNDSNSELFEERVEAIRTCIKALIDSDYESIKNNIRKIQIEKFDSYTRVSGAENFVSIKLFESEECHLKLHIYPPKISGEIEYHTHRFDVISALLEGELHEIIGKEVEGSDYEVYEIKWLGPGKTQHINTKKLISLEKTNRVHKDCVYDIPNTLYHEVENNGFTITLCMFLNPKDSSGTFLVEPGTVKSGKDMEKIYDELNLEEVKQKGLQVLVDKFQL